MAGLLIGLLYEAYNFAEHPFSWMHSSYDQ